MRVLFTTTGHSGHRLPLTPLARACADAGHEVAFATHRARAAAVEEAGLPVHALQQAPDEAWAPLLGRIATLPQSAADALILAEGFARIGGGSVLAEMVDLIGRERPDVVVHEGYEFAGPIAAERRGVPLARVALGLASTEAWVDDLAAPGVAALRRDAGLPDGPPARPLLLTLLPGSFDDGPAVRFGTGPPAPAQRLPAGWWPDRAGAPLVYVTLGSVTGSLPAFAPLYAEVVRALAGLPVRVLLTIGRDPAPDVAGPLPDNAHAAPWVDQDAVLPDAAVVVSHGGFGTTLGALAHRVPQVVIPLFAGDQWRTAERIAELGAGVTLDDGERRVFEPPGAGVLDRLPGAVERVLGADRFRRAAAALGDELAALPPPGAAVTALEAYAAAGGGRRQA